MQDSCFHMLFFRLLFLCCALLLAGCETLSYYGKGAAGQWRFYGARVPIAETLARDDLTADQRRRLELVPQIRQFARAELQLPVKGQYSDYVDVPGGTLAWNVFAAPELSLKPYRWCYLLHSLCVEYRGYFRREDAQRYANRLAARGYDVHVGEIAAFSSLGMLDDPVTSVLIGYPDDLLASVLFHELAHVELYVKDDTAFNESFAEAVAAEGLRRWRLARGDAGNAGEVALPGGKAAASRRAPDEVARRRAQQAVMIDTALAIRAQLQALYASSLPDDRKRARKQEILVGAAGDYAARCTVSGAGCGYTRWFDEGINNAKLNALATYQHWVPAFTALLRAGEVDGKPADLAPFYETVRELARLPRRQRDAILRALAPADGGTAQDRTGQDRTAQDGSPAGSEENSR